METDPRLARIERAVVTIASEIPVSSTEILEMKADVDLAAWLKVCEELVASNPTDHPDVATASENFVNLLRNEGIIQ